MLRLVKKFQTRAPVPNGDCLDWPGEVDKDGYGVVRAGHRRSGGVKGRANRVAWAAYHPDEPLPLVVRHTCDRPRCVREEHLIGGTHADNSADVVERGRWRGGKGGIGMLPLVPCPVCGTEYKPVTSKRGVRQQTCSKRCGAIFRVQRGKGC